MATLYITEYRDIEGMNQVPMEAPLAEQTVSIGMSAASSNPFGPNTTLVRLHTDAICSVLIGTNPTATASSGRMAANQTEYRGVCPNLVVSVIVNT